MKAQTAANAADSVAVKMPEITPTTTINTVARPRLESHSDFMAVRKSTFSPTGYLRITDMM